MKNHHQVREGPVTRTIDESNDLPVETVTVVPSVQNTRLIGGGTIVASGTAHDGRDDSGIARDNSGLIVSYDGIVSPSPLTITSLTAADGSVGGTLTLTGSLVGETFTLNASSNVLLGVQDVPVILSFGDGRSGTITRTITISIVEKRH